MVSCARPTRAMKDSCPLSMEKVKKWEGSVEKLVKYEA